MSEVDISLVAAEFTSATRARKAFDDLGRWSQEPARQMVSVYRLAEHGVASIIVAVMPSASGLVDPITRRLERRGGRLRNIPEADKLFLVKRFLDVLDEP